MVAFFKASVWILGHSSIIAFFKAFEFVCRVWLIIHACDIRGFYSIVSVCSTCSPKVDLLAVIFPSQSCPVSTPAKKWPGRSQTPESIAKRQAWIERVRQKSADFEARTGMPFHSEKQKARFACFMQATSKSGSVYDFPFPWRGEQPATSSAKSSSSVVWNTAPPPPRASTSAPPWRHNPSDAPVKPKVIAKPPGTPPPAHLLPPGILEREIYIAVKALNAPAPVQVPSPTEAESQSYEPESVPAVASLNLSTLENDEISPEAANPNSIVS